jgi:hypothetical protein
MATQSGNICIAAGVVSAGPWVANYGATTLVDVGHTRGVSLNYTTEDYDHETDRAFGIVKSVPIRAQGVLAAILDEATPENYALAMRQPTSNITGSAPNKSFFVDAPQEQYQRITIGTQGIGTTRARTFTLAKCRVALNGEIAFQKAAAQALPIQAAALFDDSIAAGSGQFFKFVDA